MDAEELRQRLTLLVAETPVHQCWTLSTVHLLKLVEDVQKAEREACAKVLDQMQANDRWSNYYGVAASAIRARGEA